MNTSITGSLFKCILLSTATYLVLAATSHAEQTKPTETATIFLLDDQTGEELATKHGIRPLEVDDLGILVNAVITGKTPVHVFHLAVDEDSSDNAVARLNFSPYAGGQPPIAPSPGLPLSQLAKEMQAYRKARGEWQQGILSYRKDLVSEIERFIKGVTTTQLEVAGRFDRMLAARNGKDFNRSDILGAIVAANRMLGTSGGKRFLVLNTDADDMPANRKPRTTVLQPRELDPSIELVFVNTSGIPDQSPLFRGLSSPRQHADSMRIAMEMIASKLNASEEKTNSVTDASRAVTPIK